MTDAGTASSIAAREAVLPTYARADVTIVRGEGARVWDAEGREYLDFGGGIAVVGLGHRHPAVTDSRTRAARPALACVEPLLDGADAAPRGAAVRPARGAQAFFCNSGAEANEAALKVARKATGRTGIVALEGGFHGRTLGALSATGQPAKWEGFGPLVPGMTFARPNDVESLEAAVTPGGDLAAIFVEPVLGEGGVVPLEEGFVRAAAEIAREVGALLCVDEVQAGLGRTGTFFAYEQLGIEPDLVTLAKGLANGLPIGALLVRDGVASAIGPGDHGSTFGGNPVACAAACAVVEAIDEELLANVVARGDQLASGLAGVAGVREVRGRGLLLAGVLDGDAAAVVDACRERGLLVLTAGSDVLRLLPPLVITEAEADEALSIIGAVLG